MGVGSTADASEAVAGARHWLLVPGAKGPRRPGGYGHNWRALLAAYDCPPKVRVECDVEGRKNHSVSCGDVVAARPFAWRVRNFDRWLFTDGRAG